jgi:hypothetical protein
MNWLRTVWSEFIGLFVDDYLFAVTILLWLAIAWLALPHIGLGQALPPVLLFAGLAGILVHGAIRGSRRT